MISLIIGLCLSAPIFWLGGKTYQGTWMNQVAPLFFYPLIFGVLFMGTIFAPYLSFIARSEKHSGNKDRSMRRFMKGMASFLGLIPGGVIYGVIADLLYIPYGPHNIIGMFIVGLLYIRTASFVMKRPFAITQEFVPLS